MSNTRRFSITKQQASIISVALKGFIDDVEHYKGKELDTPYWSCLQQEAQNILKDLTDYAWYK